MKRSNLPLGGNTGNGEGMSTSSFGGDFKVANNESVETFGLTAQTISHGDFRQRE